MNGSHSPGVFTSFFPNSAAMFQDHSLPQNRNLNTKYFSRMSESEGQSSQLPEQGFNIPDEFRLTPDARFGEQLGLGAGHHNYAMKISPAPGPSYLPRVNRTNHQDPTTDSLIEELLEDVDNESNSPRDNNSNSISSQPQSMIKVEKDQIWMRDGEESEEHRLFDLHSQIDIKPDPEFEKKPSLSIRKDLFQTNHLLQQPNVMSMSNSLQRGRYTSSRSDGVPLYDDPTLPPGWYRTVTQRKTGATAGGWDTYIFSPPSYGKKRFRSKQDIRRFFEKIGEMYLDWQDFDFNPFGSKGQHEMLQAQRGSEMEVKPDISSFLSCELKQEVE